MMKTPWMDLSGNPFETIEWVKNNKLYNLLTLFGTIYMIAGLFGPIAFLFWAILINRFVQFITSTPEHIYAMVEIILVMFILITVIYF